MISKPVFKLIFSNNEIVNLASKYSYARSKAGIINSPNIRNRGYLTKTEIKIIGNWKTPRSKPRIAANSEEFIKEVASIAFSTKNEKVRIETLNPLEGVSWPTASVLLHFYHKENYPILDFRALYSLNCEHIKPYDYKFDFWNAYSEFTRTLATQANVDMRTLGQALWQYQSKIRGYILC